MSLTQPSGHAAAQGTSAGYGDIQKLELFVVMLVYLETTGFMG
jgi:hypothetical protein